MANTKYILSQIKLEGELQDLIAKSDGENVSVNYHGTDMTLANALAEIFTSISSTESVDEKISAAIDALIDGAPETYDTLKEIADYIATHQDAADALSAAIGNKVDKEEGKGLSTEDFTTLLKINWIICQKLQQSKWKDGIIRRKNPKQPQRKMGLCRQKIKND